MGEPDWVGYILDADPRPSAAYDLDAASKERTVRGEFVRRIRRATAGGEAGGDEADGDEADTEADAVLRAGLVALDAVDGGPSGGVPGAGGR